MLGRWVGVLSFIALAAMALHLQDISARVSPQTLTAQASGAVGDTEAADKQCPAVTPKQTEYDPSRGYGAKRVDCGGSAPVQAGAAIVAESCAVITNLYKKPCYSSTAELYTIGHCVTANKCHADAYQDQNGKMQTIQDTGPTPVPTQVACATPGGCVPSSVAGQDVTPAPKDTSPTTPSPTSNSPANTQLPQTPVSTQVTPSPTSNPGTPPIGKIDAVANGSTGPASPVPVTGSPIAPAPTAVPGGPAFQSPTNVSAPPPTAGSVTGGPSVPPTAPTPYAPLTSSAWKPGYNSGVYSGGVSPLGLASSRSGPLLLFSSVINLVTGLFGITSSDSSSRAPAPQVIVQKPTVQNVIQLYVVGNGTSSAVKATPVIISSSAQVVSYNITIPQTPSVSLSGTVMNLPSQGSFENLLALIESNTPSGAAYGSTPASPVTPVTTQTAAPSSTTPAIPGVALSNVSTLDTGLGTTSRASSTIPTGAISPITFVEPYAVSASAPTGSDGLSSTLDVIDGYAGGWTGGKVKDPAQALLSNRAALAQVQTNYESTQAALSAWQQLAGAGLCPQTCQETIASLQSQLPGQEKQMQKLTDAIYEGAATLNRTPAVDSGITALSHDPARAAALLTTGAQSPQDLISGISALGVLPGENSPSDTGIKTITRYDLPTANASSSDGGTALITGEVQSGNSSTGIPELLAHVWSVLTSWFAPSASSTPSGIGCSLLGSLFGFCTKS